MTLTIFPPVQTLFLKSRHSNLRTKTMDNQVNRMLKAMYSLKT